MMSSCQETYSSSLHRSSYSWFIFSCIFSTYPDESIKATLSGILLMLLVWTLSEPVLTEIDVRSAIAMSSVYFIGPKSFRVFSLFCLLRRELKLSASQEAICFAESVCFMQAFVFTASEPESRQGSDAWPAALPAIIFTASSAISALLSANDSPCYFSLAFTAEISLSCVAFLLASASMTSSSMVLLQMMWQMVTTFSCPCLQSRAFVCW